MNEKIHRLKIYEADADSGYAEEKLVGSEYINVTKEDIPSGTGSRLKFELDLSAVITGVETGKLKVGKLKVSAADTTINYLVNKIWAGTDITVTRNNPGGNEGLAIATTGKVKVSSGDRHDYLNQKFTEGSMITISSSTGSITIAVDAEDTFSGLATFLPKSSALKTFFQALIVTDADDCGSSGDAIMYEKKDIPTGQMMIIESDNALINFVDHYPAPTDLVRLAPGTTSQYIRLAFGCVKIGSIESDAAGNAFVAALINFMLDEDYISGEDIYLDVMFKLADSSDLNAETLLRAYPYYVLDADNSNTALTVVDKSIEWNKDGADVFEWHTFTIEGVTSNTKPTSMSVFLACMSEDGTYDVGTEAKINNATIVQARVRYKKKTIQLPTASVVL